MARLLDAVTPLADLLARTPDPAAAVAAVRAAVGSGPDEVAGAVVASGVHGRLAAGAILHAGITPEADPGTLAAVAGALEVLVAQRVEGDVSLVFTVPAFLAAPFDAFTAAAAGVRAERTAAVVSEVAAAAAGSLTIAAPYLAAVALESLLPHVRRVLTGGGTVTVITRALAPWCPDPSEANIAAVAAVRAADPQAGGRLRVCSWEEEGLGVHLKAVVADASTAHAAAYLGSANLTGGGQAGHAEAGVRLPARLAGPLGAWLELLAGALEARRAIAAPR